MRAGLRSASVAIIALLFVSSAAQPQTTCSTCAPEQREGYGPAEKLTVFLPTTLSPADRTAIVEGINLWNTWFNNNDVNLGFQIVNSGPADITMILNPNLTDDGMKNIHNEDGSGTVYVNPAYLGKGLSSFLKQCAGHEFGHSLGFPDVGGTSCRSYTIMYGNIAVSGPFTTSLKSCDLVSLRESFIEPQPPPTESIPEVPCNEPGCSPIVIELDHGGYRLTGADDPVLFDLNADGAPEWLTWTDPYRYQPFLALDRDGNGFVDNGRELFGTFTPLEAGGNAQNGFVALAEFDDDANGFIDAGDPIWNELLLWHDANHDGFSQRNEVTHINASEVERISTAHRWSGRRDEHGNTFRYRGTVTVATLGGKRVQKPVYDIYFVLVD